MSQAPLLLEIGCEEIPARMIRAAAEDLRGRVVRILDQAGLTHGEARCWGGSRRLAVRVDAVAGRQQDRDELLTGPPASVAFDADGKPTPAAAGFARKQGIDPAELRPVETAKGTYAGVQRRVPGRGLGAVLGAALPAAVEGMSFPKSMRWGQGSHRWVRPVHWLVALHGDASLELELFGIRSGSASRGHRFLSDGAVEVPRADDYASALRAARVVVDPAERQATLAELLREQAGKHGGALVEDAALLDEIADLVEWPQVVAGTFDRRYLDLPREILITTLRYHQKCFAVQDDTGALLPAFLAVANMQHDPAGHIRRGNEWVVGGRLEDAVFFWGEDRKRLLAERQAALAGVAFHKKLGSYADKAGRVAALAAEVAAAAGLDGAAARAAEQAAALCKNDLVTGTVGEFPELQGIVGGLMLCAEGAEAPVWRAVYEHYRPAGPDDPLPETDTGCAVAVADKLDALARLIEIGEVPSSSRDPFGLRRAANGVFRIVMERAWPLSQADLVRLASPDGNADIAAFLSERLENFLRERGYTTNEVRAVLLAGGAESADWTLDDVRARLDAVKQVRDRDDFRHLVELTKRVANIQRKNHELAAAAIADAEASHDDPEPAVRELDGAIAAAAPRIDEQAAGADYRAVIDALAAFVTPVDEFFDRALVIDPEDPKTTAHRLRLLWRLRAVLTRHFDISQLSGEADRRTP
jgi:glycyl-tRNA synthetase beta chain